MATTPARVRPSVLPAAFVAVALAGAAAAAPLAAAPAATPRGQTLVAQILQPVVARTAPADHAARSVEILNYTDFSRQPNVLMVTRTKAGPDGRTAWVQVQVPGRPNGRRAWVPASAVQLRGNPLRVQVHLRSRTLDLLRNGTVIMRLRAAVGTGGTPTPAGHWAIRDIWSAPASSLGPKILVLTANSTVLRTFDGGTGEIAIHGWPSSNSIGQAASHGCVRLSRAAVAALARYVSIGTPVDILRT